MMPESNPTDISVIVPVVERYDNLTKLYNEYSAPFRDLGKNFEFIFVVDGTFDEALVELQEVKKSNSNINIAKLVRNFGESTALSIGSDIAKGEYIFTLSAYFQVEPSDIKRIWNGLIEGNDLVISRRYPRIDSKFNQFQSNIYHRLIRSITSLDFHDVSCGLKGMKRKVFEEIRLYGDLHRFIPILAFNKGFKVKEVDVQQRQEDSAIRIVRLGTYLRRFLDILTLFFITKFTMKPLRFFGLIGMMLGSIGILITSYLGVYRILGMGGIANRPVLLLGVLLLVLGFQSLSIGLIGEMIIFTHARDMREYNIDVFLEKS